MNRLLVGMATGALLWCSSAGVAAAQNVATPALQKVDVEERLGAPIPLDIPLVDEVGHQVMLRDFFPRKRMRPVSE